MAHKYQGGRSMAYTDEAYRCPTGRHGGNMAFSDTSKYSGTRSIVAYSNSDECYDTARHGGRRGYEAGEHGGRKVYSDEGYHAGRHGGGMVYSDEAYDDGRCGGRRVYSADRYVAGTGGHGGRMVYSDEGYHAGRHGGGVVCSDEGYHAGRHGGGVVYSDEDYNDGRHGGRRMVYSNADHYDRRQVAAYGEDYGYRANDKVCSKEEREWMGDRPRPAAYTNSSSHTTRVADGQQGYYKSEEGVIATGGGTIYSDEYARVAGGQQGCHKSTRKIEEGMSAMTLGSAGGSASGERSEQHDASYYSKMEKQHRRRETLDHLGAMAAAAFAMHESHMAKKVDPEDAEAHIIKEAMATAVASSSADWAIHEFRRKKDAQSLKASVE